MPRSPLGPVPAGAAPVAAAERAALDRALAEHGVHVPDGPEGAATALLPVLHHLQDALGHVPPALVPLIAQAFNRTRAEVHGVVSFYHHFRSAPPGRHVVQICQAEACRACGGEALMAHTAAALGCAPGQTRADCAVSLEAAYCLGLCATAPAAMIDGRVRARVSPAQIEALAAVIAGEVAALAAPGAASRPDTGASAPDPA